MPIEIKMPRLSDTMEEGTLIKWHVKQGQKVEPDEVLAEVETDKAMMEMPTYDAGEVAALLVEEGQTVGVGTVLAVLAGEGETASEIASQYQNGSAKGSDEQADEDDADAEERERTPQRRRDDARQPRREREELATPRREGRAAASPLVRRLAEEHGLDLSDIDGSGPGGRIVKRDIMDRIEGRTPSPRDAGAPTRRPTSQAPSAAPAAIAQPSTQLGEKIPMSTMRQTIARRLVESKTTIPHYQVTAHINAEPLLELRRQINEGLEEEDVKLSVNDFLVRACAVAIHRHPLFNARWNGDSIIVQEQVNIGVAIALPAERGGGLVVATLYDADRMPLRELSEETRRLAEKARTKGLSVEELSGATFTISNMGMYDVDEFNAIINPPNVAILAVSAARETPVVRDGQIVVGKQMSCVLSNDHRVIDGATAAEFLQTLKHILEHPGSMLV